MFNARGRTDVSLAGDLWLMAVFMAPLAVVALMMSGAEFELFFGAGAEDWLEGASIGIALLGVLLRVVAGGFSYPAGDTALGNDAIRRMLRTPVAVSDALIMAGIAIGTQVWWFACLALCVTVWSYRRAQASAERLTVSTILTAPRGAGDVVPLGAIFRMAPPAFSLKLGIRRAYPSLLLVVTFATLMEVAHDFEVGAATLTSWPSDWPYYFATLAAGCAGWLFARGAVNDDAAAAGHGPVRPARRIMSSALLHNAGTIALVGNGRVAKSDAPRIDDHDCVIRINRAQLCGSAGDRTDILAVLGVEAILEVTARGLPINLLALHSTREIWSIDELPADDGVITALCGARPILRIETDARSDARTSLLGHANAASVKPTTGAVVLAYLLKNSTACITLFGFSHEGSKVHNWDAERAWMDALAATPRVTRAKSDGPAVQLPAPDRAAAQIQRLLNHFAAGRF